MGLPIQVGVDILVWGLKLLPYPGHISHFGCYSSVRNRDFEKIACGAHILPMIICNIVGIGTLEFTLVRSCVRKILNDYPLYSSEILHGVITLYGGNVTFSDF